MNLKCEKTRLAYLDNLRATMVILVVIMHAAVTYSGFGSWYYIETKTLDTLSALFFGLYQAFTQAYFMSLLFMLAGYFIPYSMAGQQIKQYILKRLFRLGLPLLVFVFLLNPLVMKLGHPEIVLTDYYVKGILTFAFVSWTGPLWFVETLLLFTLIYLSLRKLFTSITFSLNINITSKNILLLILCIAFLAFIIRIPYPIGTSVANLQFCYFSAYIFMFSIGILSYYAGLFEKVDYALAKHWFIVSLVIGVPFWFVLMLIGGPIEGNFTFVNGGLHWQSLAFSLWESFFCVTFIIGLIGLFRHRVNSQNLLQRFLSDNSFAVYVFHALILTSISVLLKGWVLPPVLKFIIVAIFSLVVSYSFSYLIREVSFLRKLFS